MNAFVSTSATALLISEKRSYQADADSSPERYPNRTTAAARAELETVLLYRHLAVGDLLVLCCLVSRKEK